MANDGGVRLHPGETERSFALLRRIEALSEVERLWLLDAVARLHNASASPAARRASQQRAALEALRAVASAAGLEVSTPPTVEQFKQHAPSVAPGWTVSKIVRLFGRC